MKRFIKGRWFPLAVAGVCALILFCLGFRITYAPKLENSWEAVSAVATWAGAIGTFGAVWFAIRVSDKQNKIALFEKRYKIYNSFIQYHILARIIGTSKTSVDIQRNFIYELYGSWNESQIEIEQINLKTEEMQYEMTQARFLFDEETGLKVSRIIDLIVDVVDWSFVPEQNEQMKKAQKELLAETSLQSYALILQRMHYYMDLNK